MMDHLVAGFQRPPSWISGIGVYGGKRKMNGRKEDGMGKECGRIGTMGN